MKMIPRMQIQRSYFLKLSLLLLIVAALPLFAEEMEDESIINVEFSVFPLEPAEWKGISYSPTGDLSNPKEALRFNPHERTLGFRYNGPTPIRFFRKTKSPEGEVLYKMVAQVSPEKTRGNFIFFFNPRDRSERKSEGPYDVFQMEDTKESFPKDSIVFFNATSATFEGIFNEQLIRIRPGVSKPIPVGHLTDKPTPIGLVVREGEKMHKILANNLRFYADRRTLMILRSPKKATSMRIRLQRLTEYMGNRSDANDPGA